ncbi:tetratricopeptide repeat protein [Sphingomonas piscis]|uniref:Tetratricopeptide repeat protein n=1 Tax=Sphingomonas piscis TaxID=2714943 RepID=A0A6G7YSS3_9SPHN|nr:tetratricopeptide repeat protein [Sphingomonas piscis]QIK79795.1 tetratricopeptide repeat protein [Sphingomonas piscis]
MRFKPQMLVLGLAAFALGAPVSGQRSDDQLNPRSVELQKQGEAHYSAGRFNEATDTLETALAVDPRNRTAFVDLARVATKEKLFGKAIRLTNKALLLDPNDSNALSVQGVAMVELGASARAQANLQKLKQLCPQGCPQLSALSSALTRGPTVASAKQATTTKTN